MIVHDLNDAHTQRPLPSIKSSQQFSLSTINVQPLDDSSGNADDPTRLSSKPSGMIPPSRFKQNVQNKFHL